jgi:ABC-type multidrug transport system ATPase subunit
MLAIELQGVHKSWNDNTQALVGLDLRVSRGTVHALLGPNGAGKTTAMRIVATLSRPTAGHVRVLGLDPLSQGPEVRRSLGYVPQALALDELSTPRQVLTLHARLHGLARSAAAGAVTALCERFDLAAYLDHRVGTLSGGLHRRFQITAALLHAPPLLLLDEPTLGLDPHMRHSLWQLLRNLCAEQGVTVLFSTHYLDEAEASAHEVSIIDSGRVVAAGAPQQLAQGREKLEIVLSGPDEAAHAQTLTRDVPNLEASEVQGNRLWLILPDSRAAVVTVIVRLHGAGVSPVSVAIRAPSLEDTYLQRTAAEAVAKPAAMAAGPR